MEILWHQNPLRTKIILDDADKATLRQKITIDQLEWALASVRYSLEKESPDISRVLSELSHYEKAIEDVDKPEGDLSDCIQALQGWHIGDCTCVPCSCEKCRAEDFLGVNTISGLGKHSASQLSSAFGEPEEDRSIDEAIANLEAPIPLEPNDIWKSINRDPEGIKRDWLSYRPRWEVERRHAVEWLKKYKAEKFSAANI